MRSAALIFLLSLATAAWSQTPASEPIPGGAQGGVTAPQPSAITPGTLPGTVPGIQPGVAPPAGYQIIPARVPPALTPGQLQLIDLETRFASATAEGGGKAFAQWFAEDAVTLSNGKPAVLGRGAIAAQANWSPTDYTLTWVPQGAQMSPANDMGFTWGHYEGKSMGLDGKPVRHSRPLHHHLEEAAQRRVEGSHGRQRRRTRRPKPPTAAPSKP